MGTDRIGVSAGFLLFLSVLLLFLPLPWLAAIVLSCIVHEAGHYFAIRLLGGKGSKLHFRAFSAYMPLTEMGRGSELICALAGPAAGLTMLLWGRWLPRTAVCALGQSVFNLMPIYPLDGGRALRCGMEMALDPPSAEKVCRNVSGIFRVILAGIAVYAAFFLRLGLLPLLLAVTLLFRLK